jgi:hypothetical protein
MNKAHEILVVREKYFVIPHWKLPGGYGGLRIGTGGRHL